MPRRRLGPRMTDAMQARAEWSRAMFREAPGEVDEFQPPPAPPRPLAPHEILAYVLGRMPDVKTLPSPQVPPSKPE